MAEYKTFELTDQHIKLLHNLNITWCGGEDGAPGADTKRPYGNGDVVGDVGRILDIEPEVVDYGDKFYSERQYKELLAIHEQTATALAIVLYTKSFVPGTYKTSSSYTSDWALVTDK